ncbi:MAG: thiamine pyrophosphate-dependent dehydrogenase E1 component subunit alpha [Firmicutes bacterium]|nr:thiamine pyrophosphate-dependent dehydrogenase E1 component subunit alpha [Bacillota bacterium]
MFLTRAFERKVDELFSKDMVHGTTHLYIGEEACAVGACMALRPDDFVTSTHRGHGHCIGKGADVRKMIAELLGKTTGYCRGKGGSMHIADVDSGNLGANGIVAGSIPIAVGAALSMQVQGSDRVVVCFFGDGAINQGAFHEAANLAAIWKLPVIFLCENNQYAVSMSVAKATAVERLAVKAEGYGFPGVTLDGNDVLEVHRATKEAVERARSGEGPTFLECLTYRWLGHSRSDPRSYRTREEEELWKEKCPLKRLHDTLLEEFEVKPAELTAIEQEVERELDEAVTFAAESPEPAPEELFTDVYA